jgi:hypothetical protein
LENRENVFVGRSPIIQMTESDGKLFCSTLGDSCSSLEWDDEATTFNVVLSDPTPRLTTFHHYGENDILYVADKEGMIVGLRGSGMPLSHLPNG